MPCGDGREAEPPIYPQGLRSDQRSSAEPFEGSAENSSSSLVEASDGFELETPQHSVLEVRTQLDRQCIENDSEEGAMSNEGEIIADRTVADDARSVAGTHLGDQCSANSSTARPANEQTSVAEQHAIDDAVAFFSSESAAWMHQEGGIKRPSVAEAARLRLISDRLVQHKRDGDLEGAVMTYLEIEIKPPARPTKQERKKARAKMEAFFASRLGV